MPMLGFDFSSERQVSMDTLFNTARNRNLPTYVDEQGNERYSDEMLSQLYMELEQNRKFEPYSELNGNLDLLNSGVTGQFTRHWSKRLTTEVQAQASPQPNMSSVMLESVVSSPQEQKFAN
jgi:hypothetical protein